MFQMIEEGEIICLDDAESDDDMGGGTNDNREDVKIVDFKEGALGSLDNVAVTKKPEVGPSDRSSRGEGKENDDEV